jgi:hypothetical protein
MNDATTIREAKVVSNTDTTKTGKIQVRILPEMQTFSEDLCPWVDQYISDGTGLSATAGCHNVYEIGSFVRVLIEDFPFMRRIRVISDDYVEGLYCYQNLDLTPISELSSQTYPQPIFKMFADGVITFHNTSTGEMGILYKNGGYSIVDTNGNIYANSIDKEIKFYNSKASIAIAADGKLEITSTSDLDISISGNSKLSTTGTTDISSTGDLTVTGSGNLTISGLNTKITGGTLVTSGTVSPTGSGPYCGLPYCLYTGAPHTGTTVSGT